MHYRLENHTAKKMNEIFHKVRIFYKLYSLKQDGSVRNCLGTNESLDRLLTKNEGYLHNGDKYIVRKVVMETKEEPVFKVITTRRKRK